MSGILAEIVQGISKMVGGASPGAIAPAPGSVTPPAGAAAGGPGIQVNIAAPALEGVEPPVRPGPQTVDLASGQATPDGGLERIAGPGGPAKTPGVSDTGAVADVPGAAGVAPRGALRDPEAGDALARQTVGRERKALHNQTMSAMPIAPEALDASRFNLTKFDGDVGKWLSDASTTYADKMKSAQGFRSLDEIQVGALAQASGMSPADVMRIRAATGEQFNAGWMVVNDLVGKIRERAKYVAETGDEKAMIEMRRLQDIAVTATLHLKGQQAEAARALSSMRLQRHTAMSQVGAIEEALKDYGGRGANRHIAAMIASLPDEASALTFSQGLAKASTWDHVTRFYKNALLSAPPTWVINISSNSLNYLGRGALYAEAAVIGQMRNGFRRMAGLPPSDAMAMGEALRYFEGLRDVGKAWGRASDAFVSGVGRSATDVSRLDAVDPRAMGSAAAMTSDSPSSMIGRAAGQVYEYTAMLPGRIQLAPDEFIREVVEGGELRMQAHRVAVERGMSGAEIDSFVRQAAADPDTYLPGWRVQAEASSRSVTFQQELGENPIRALGFDADKFVGSMLRMRDAGGLGANIVFPFVRTPYNITKHVLESTPIGLAVMPDLRAGLAAGGRQRDLALAKVVNGAALTLAAVETARDGIFTGSGPIDPALNREWLSLGNQPNAMVIRKDGWIGKVAGLEKDLAISLSRADPFGAHMTLAAEVADVMAFATPEEQGDLIDGLTVFASRQMLNRAYMRGVGDFSKTLDAARQGRADQVRNYLTSIAASFAAPGALGFVAENFTEGGELRRDTRAAGVAEARAYHQQQGGLDATSTQLMGYIEETVNKIKARTPGMGKDLPPLTDFFGQEVKRHPGMAWGLVPLRTSELEFDSGKLAALGVDPARWSGTPSAQFDMAGWREFIDTVGPSGEFIRLGKAFDMPAREVRKIPLTPWEFHEYNKAINEYRPGIGMLFDERKAVAYEFSGQTLKQAMTGLMRTEWYKGLPDDPLAPVGKQEALSALISRYRHGSSADRDPDTGLGGADRVLYEHNDGFRARYREGHAIMKGAR